MTPIESSAARRTHAIASRGQSSRRVLTTNSAIRAMALMGGDYAVLLGKFHCLGSHGSRTISPLASRRSAHGNLRSFHRCGSPRRARLTSHCHGAPRLARFSIISPLGSSVERPRLALLCVVKDDAERVAGAGGDATDAVAHGDAMPAAVAARRPLARGEDHQLTLLGGDRLAARLRARPLLDQQEVATLVVDAPAAQEAGDLQWKGDVAVQILVQAVVSAGFVMQQKRRRLGLPGAPTDGEQAGEIIGIAPTAAERLLPAIGDLGQRRIGVGSEIGDDGWERVAKVLVVAE